MEQDIILSMAAQNLQYEGIEHYEVRRPLPLQGKNTLSNLYSGRKFSFGLYGEGRKNRDRVGLAVTNSGYLTTFMTAKRLKECWKGRLQIKQFRRTALQIMVVHSPHPAIVQHKFKNAMSLYFVDLIVSVT